MSKESFIAHREEIMTMSIDEFLDELNKRKRFETKKIVEDSVESLAFDMESKWK